MAKLRAGIVKAVRTGRERTRARKHEQVEEKRTAAVKRRIGSARRKAPKSAPTPEYVLKRGKRYTTPEALAALHAELSWQRIAKIVNLSRGQLAKLRKGIEPKKTDDRIVRAVKAVHATFDEIRREKTRELAAQRKRGSVPRATRVMRIDPKDKAGKARIPSDTVEFNILRASPNAIAARLRTFRDRASFAGIGGAVRFLVLHDDNSPDYPGEFAWTDWEGGMSSMTDADIEAIIGEAFDKGAPVAMRVIDA